MRVPSLLLLSQLPTVLAAGTWHVVEGYNAVLGETACTGSRSECTSIPAVRNAGHTDSAEQCRVICASLASNEPEPCTVFAWSGSTHSCWLRFDSMWGAPGTLVPEPKRTSGCLLSSQPNATSPRGCDTNPLARHAALGAVVAAPSATAVEIDAAEQLGFYLGNMGGWLPGPSPVVRRPTVAVGFDASISAGLVRPEELVGLGDDGFVMVSNDSSGSVAVTGGRHAARGCLFGAYDLLRRMGCEFLSPEMLLAEELPTVPVSALPHIHARVVPPIAVRDSNEFGQTKHPRWAAKVGMNGGFATSAATKGGTRLFPRAWPFARFWTSDSFALLGPTPYPSPELWAHHREWFWPRSDRDNHTQGQLCWHNSSLVTLVIANVKSLLRSNPNATVVMVAQEDNGKYCNDSEAQRIIAEEGTAGGPLFRAINAIAQAIEGEFPSVYVQTLAYEWSRFPPRLTRPRHNVIVQLCDIEANFGAPLSDPSNHAFQRTIGGWQALTNGTDDG
jgi:hypothetical protein